MDKEHVISDEALNNIHSALSSNQHWLAYNSVPYFLEKGDVYAFRDKEEAQEFAANNISEYDCYNIIYAGSIADVFQKIPYGKNFEETISSSIKTKIMDEKTMGFNESQLMRSGFGEAFTPELQQKMQDREPIIQQQFKKEFEGDKVEATLHLKKSASSDYYFLNKFDMQLQKDGQADSVKQTFYISAKRETGDENNQQKQKHENRYTLKEAYNLLSGRPVHKHLVNKEGNPYEAWVKLNFKNKLESGNHELKQYTNNYGFDLQNVLAKYPIKELGNELYKNSLIDSLNRGNLQKATFTDKDGKEEKLFISPNITLGALNVYDQNKQRIPTDKLVEREYIGKELGDQLKERMNKVSQEQKPEQKKQQAEKIVKPPKQKRAVKQRMR